tara:strand:- start:1182 stop:1421 length:240 start_codon:yes stop_codon:yes gene_type:complete
VLVLLELVVDLPEKRARVEVEVVELLLEFALPRLCERMLSAGLFVEEFLFFTEPFPLAPEFIVAVRLIGISVMLQAKEA